MECKIAAAGIEQRAAFKAAVNTCGGDPHFEIDAGPRPGRRRCFVIPRCRSSWRCSFAWQRARNAIVRRLNDPADRLRAISQRRWTTDHLDLVADQWIDRHEMVLAQIGSAVGADAVLLDADSIDIETANDRTAGSARGETGAGNTGLRKQQIAERTGRSASNFLTRHDRHGGKLICDDRGCARQGTRGGGDCFGLRGRLRRGAGRGSGGRPLDDGTCHRDIDLWQCSLGLGGNGPGQHDGCKHGA